MTAGNHHQERINQSWVCPWTPWGRLKRSPGEAVELNRGFKAWGSWCGGGLLPPRALSYYNLTATLWGYRG